MQDIIFTILSKIDFHKQRVLIIGCGQGEEIHYAERNGAAFCAEAVLSKDGEESSAQKLHTRDAAAYFEETRAEVFSGHMLPFDVVLIFDSLESLPRGEAKTFFSGLSGIMSPTGLLAVNVPAYLYDRQAEYNCGDQGNPLLNETDSSADSEISGAVRSYYSTIALQALLLECGFAAITEAHFFSLRSEVDASFSKISYYQRWEKEKARGVALIGAYEDDVVEYPLGDAPQIELVSFKEGVLSGITLLTTPEYCDLAYKDGNIDVEAILDLQKIVEKEEHAIVFDVGGYVGANALVYAKLAGEHGTIVVFEPNPYNRNRIFKNLSHNPELQARIWVEPVALSDESGTCEMVLSSNIDSGYSSTSRISHAHAKIADNNLPAGFVKHTVLVTTLDEYVKESRIVPNIIKVDVEGAEYMLLQGAQTLLRNSRPIFYVEYHSEYCATMCSQMFFLNGYIVYPCKEEEDNRLIVKAEFAAETSAHSGVSGSGVRRNDAAQLEHAAGCALERKEVERLTALCEDLTREKASALEQTEQLQQEIHRLSGELDQVRNSTSWKITAFPRKMMDSIKTIVRKR